MFKIVGLLIGVVAVAAAIAINSYLDPRVINTSNDFINQLIHSQGTLEIADRMKFYIAIAVAGIGLCFGWLSFGVGVVLARLRKLA